MVVEITKLGGNVAKVYINGIEALVPKELGVGKFFSSMMPKKGNCFELDSKYGKRTIALQRSGKTTSGLVLINTEQGAFITSTVENGRLKTKVLSTSDSSDQPSTGRQEFIFFVFHDNTGRGLFTQYKGSGGVGLLRSIFPSQYDQFARMEKQSLLHAGKDADAEKIKNAKMVMSNLAPNHDFEKALKNMVHFNHFDFALPHASYKPVGALGKHVEAERISLRFKLASRNYIKDLYNGIVSFVASNNVESGAVHGQDSHGEVLDVPIDPDALSFSSDDFNKIAVQENFDADNLASTSIIKKLRGIMDANKELFENAKS